MRSRTLLASLATTAALNLFAAVAIAGQPSAASLTPPAKPPAPRGMHDSGIPRGAMKDSVMAAAGINSSSSQQHRLDACTRDNTKPGCSGYVAPTGGSGSGSRPVPDMSLETKPVKPNPGLVVCDTPWHTGNGGTPIFQDQCR